MLPHQRLCIRERRRQRRHSLRRPPGATATFLSSPRRFARFTGEFLNRRENSAWSIPISSISFAPCTPARGRNASSGVICTNFGAFQGHTSWELCRFNTFVIELTTGRNRTTSEERGVRLPRSWGFRRTSRDQVTRHGPVWSRPSSRTGRMCRLGGPRTRLLYSEAGGLVGAPRPGATSGPGGSAPEFARTRRSRAAW
jgi:hypothetical protein